MLRRTLAPCRMNVLSSMFSMLSGAPQWSYEQVMQHSQLTDAELKASHDYLIDVREVGEVQRCGPAIPNAINIPSGELGKVLASPASFPQIWNARETPSPAVPEHHLVFTCQSGVRALQAASTAKSAGFKRVSVYSGSYSEWCSRSK